ncbi:MAG: hypothetical protein L6R41_002604 [Letrouitia leprolyta]|nr:MAG: hypothetical protein L6R41_002604 [Letrouitia leprolyta]
MASARLSSILFLYAAALVGIVIALPEVFQWKKTDVLLQEREICYDDDTLLSFRYWIIDSGPYCSSLLKLEDVTSTLPPATSRTTTTTVIDRVTTLPSTLTVPRITALETITANVGRLAIRDPAATITSVVNVETQPYPYNYVSSLALSADQNAAVASSVFSACSCLHLRRKTVSSQSTVLSTRSISGFNDGTEYAATVTADTTTLTVTQNAIPQIVQPSSNVSTASSNSSGSVASSVFSNSLVTTISLTSTRTNTVYSTGTGLPYFPNTTSISPPYPTTNITSSSLNASSSSSTSSPSEASSSPSPLPIGNSITPSGCPSINNTIYTLDTGEQYQLQCYRRYGGAATIGLDQNDFRECIGECSIVNRGFSLVRCYGVTWLKYDKQGIRCNLKSQTNLGSFTTYELAVSAVLLTGVPAPIVGAFEGGTRGLEAREASAEDDDLE